MRFSSNFTIAFPLVTVTEPSILAPLAMARTLATISPSITAEELTSSLSSMMIFPVIFPASTAWRAWMSPCQCALLPTDNVPPTLFEAIAHVVRRQTSGGQTIGPGQKLTPLEALAAASREGAYLSFDENEKGTIEAGKLADLAVLSEDLLTVDEERIRHISSVLTITGGRTVHDDGTLTGVSVPHAGRS